jgi:hypothetical protein
MVPMYALFAWRDDGRDWWKQSERPRRKVAVEVLLQVTVTLDSRERLRRFDVQVVIGRCTDK